MQTAPPGGPTDLPPSGTGSNPFLAAPDPNKATEYKRGYMMRKCCVDPNGKRSERVLWDGMGVPKIDVIRDRMEY